MPSDQPVFVADYREERSRLTTFFRLFLAIPHLIVVSLWGIGAFFAILAAWFILLFTGRWPQGLYDFVGGFLRYSTAVYGYLALLTDEYPPFSGDTGGYPVRIELPPPKPEYNRMKVLFRIFLAIPILIVMYAMQIVWEVGSFLAWFAIVALGKQPKGLQDMTVLGLSYQQRAAAYLYLLTEDWPPFSNPEPVLEPGPGPASSLPPSPARPEAPVATGAGGSFAPPSHDAPPPAPPSPDAPESPPRREDPPPPPPPPGGVTGGDPLGG